MTVATYRHGTTSLDHRPSRQTLLDGPGRSAHAYGSEGWGFESLRARQQSTRSRARPSIVAILVRLIWSDFGLTGLVGRAVEAVRVTVHVAGAGRRPAASW